MANPKYRTSGIPLDLTSSILYKLPAKTLLRFRCLSKPLCSLIDSPDFIILHFSQYISSRLNFIVKDLSLYSLELNSFDNTIQVNDLSEDPKVFGSCNGFLALSNPHRDISLFNPSNRILFKLPFPHEDFHGGCDSGVAFLGFGYDHVNDHYKVVRIVRFRFEHGNDRSFTDYEVQVFSSKTNSWRRINIFPNCFRFISEIYNPLSDRRRYGVFVSGGLHWLFPRSPDLGTGNSIVAFDLSAEAFSVLPQPGNSDFEKDDVLDLVVLMGRLCLVSMYDEAILDIWMMKKYGVKESWIKFISIDRSNTTNSFSFSNPLHYSEWGGDEFVLEVDEEPVSYDLKREGVKTVRIDKGDPNLFAAEAEEEEEEEEQEQEQEQEQEEIKILDSFQNSQEILSKYSVEDESFSYSEKRKKRIDFLGRGFKLFLHSITKRCRIGTKGMRQVQSQPSHIMLNHQKHT